MAISKDEVKDRARALVAELRMELELPPLDYTTPSERGATPSAMVHDIRASRRLSRRPLSVAGLGRGVTSPQAEWFADAFAKILGHIYGYVAIEEGQLELILTALFARESALIDLPHGASKRALCDAIASSISGDYALLPMEALERSDVLGITVYDAASQQFLFRKGMIYSTVVLADRINTAPRPTAAAFYDAIDERRVFVDGMAYELPSVQLLLATIDDAPGAPVLVALDASHFGVSIPAMEIDRDSTVEYMRAANENAPAVPPIIARESLATMQALASMATVDGDTLTLILDIVEMTRRSPKFQVGADMRAALALTSMCRVRALAKGRPSVTRGDVEEMAEYVLGHRLVLSADALASGESVARSLATIVHSLVAAAENRDQDAEHKAE